MVALGDPGKVPTPRKGKTGIEELMSMVASDIPDDKLPDISRLCATTWVLKGLRTKYCKESGFCIEEFDHYCVWLNCSIGKNNHRLFITLAVVEVFTQFLHIYLCGAIAWTISAPTLTSWLINVASGYPLLVIMFILQMATA